MSMQIQVSVNNFDEAFIQHIMRGGFLFGLDDYEVADRVLANVNGEPVIQFELDAEQWNLDSMLFPISDDRFAYALLDWVKSKLESAFDKWLSADEIEEE